MFGAKRGAYSGADADAAGYLQEADGGTLFLDEIAELDAQVQAKLLRALESKEILPLGAAKPRKVELGFVSATNKDLRALVAAGALREDLYFRIGSPAVTLPPLRNRPEEIAPLVAGEMAKAAPALTAHVSLVEQCLLRPWPGNVRELIAEVRAAAQTALADGNRVTARHLSATAGSMFSQTVATGATPPTTPVPARRRRRPASGRRSGCRKSTRSGVGASKRRSSERRQHRRHGARARAASHAAAPAHRAPRHRRRSGDGRRHRRRRRQRRRRERR